MIVGWREGRARGLSERPLALGSDAVEAPPGPALRLGDGRVFPECGEETPAPEAVERLVERAVGEERRASHGPDGRGRLVAVELGGAGPGAVSGKLEDFQLEREQGSGLSAHARHDPEDTFRCQGKSGSVRARGGRLCAMQRVIRWMFAVVAMAAVLAGAGIGGGGHASAGEDPVSVVIEPQLDGSQFVTVVFHALDRDGFCQPPPGAVSLHPVLDMPVDFIIEAGEGIIIETSSGPLPGARSAYDVRTFSTAANAAAGSPRRAFPPLVDSVSDECQAWVRISQSIPGPLRVLVFAPGDGGGEVGFVVEAGRETTNHVPLGFRWTLVTWTGGDRTPVAAALAGVQGTNVTAIYGWDGATQGWLAYFPGGADVPGANTLSALEQGRAYWVAVDRAGGSWAMPSAR